VVLAVAASDLAAAGLFTAGGIFLLWRGRRDAAIRAAHAREAGLEPRRRFSFDMLFGTAALVLAVLVLFGFNDLLR
jgi:hypothetical protein